MNPSLIENTLYEYFPVDECIVEPENQVLTEEVTWNESWIVHAPNLRFIKGLKAKYSNTSRDYLIVDNDLILHAVKVKEESLESKFRRHLESFNSETLLTSSIDKIVGNLNYLKIIALGSEAIPLILREYFTNGGFWHNALVALTEENPTTAEMHGKQKLIREAWRTWAVEHGYI